MTNEPLAEFANRLINGEYITIGNYFVMTHRALLAQFENSFGCTSFEEYLSKEEWKRVDDKEIISDFQLQYILMQMAWFANPKLLSHYPLYCKMGAS